jgi:hypothetical protein
MSPKIHHLRAEFCLDLQDPENVEDCFSAICWNLHQSAELKSGGRGIRTPGPVTVNGFQDRLIKPL